jgi:hypothetical protein
MVTRIPEGSGFMNLRGMNMIAALRRLSLMNRLSLTAVLALLAMLLIVWESLWSLHGLLYSDRQVKTRHLVETASASLIITQRCRKRAR